MACDFPYRCGNIDYELLYPCLLYFYLNRIEQCIVVVQYYYCYHKSLRSFFTQNISKVRSVSRNRLHNISLDKLSASVHFVQTGRCCDTVKVLFIISYVLELGDVIMTTHCCESCDTSETTASEDATKTHQLHLSHSITPSP